MNASPGDAIQCDRDVEASGLHEPVGDIDLFDRASMQDAWSPRLAERIVEHLKEPIKITPDKAVEVRRCTCEAWQAVLEERPALEKKQRFALSVHCLL